MKLTDKKFKTTTIKGKPYVDVAERLRYLAFDFKGEYSIHTEYNYFESRKMWVVKATLTLSQEGITSTYTGLAQEVESENVRDVNFSSALENAETSAVGRACAIAGIGIDISIASADEMKKALNRSGSPLESQQTTEETNESVKSPLIRKRAEILLLLNNPTITQPEKEKMIANINKLDEERADQAIEKLKKTIEERKLTREG